ENLIIRPYNDLDWEPFLQFMLCRQVTSYLNFTSEQTKPKGAKELFEMTLNSYNTPSPLFALVIAKRENNLFIGSCGFSPLDKSRNCECFYALLPEYWCQGFATEAMTQLLDYGFHQLGITKVIAHINRDNLASIQVAKKLAMSYQGLIEFKGVPEQGKLFSITQENYINRSQKRDRLPRN
ncbi:MAG: GNAT family protein, partial [Cyanobacteria bacterium P01_E01_bin.35]